MRIRVAQNGKAYRLESIFSSLYLVKIQVLQATICHRTVQSSGKIAVKKSLLFWIGTIDTKESLGSMSARRRHRQAGCALPRSADRWLLWLSFVEKGRL